MRIEFLFGHVSMYLFVDWIMFLLVSLAGLSIFLWNMDGIYAYGTWLKINFNLFWTLYLGFSANTLKVGPLELNELALELIASNFS
jgi:hypothetical protein